MLGSRKRSSSASGPARRSSVHAPSSATASACVESTAASRHACTCASRSTPSTKRAPHPGERARAELRATGETVPPRDPSAPERLTPQELQIALLVADGKSNRDVAGAMFVSRKTVEYHLTHIYRKLDVHSRAALTRLFAASGAPSAAAPL